MLKDEKRFLRGIKKYAKNLNIYANILSRKFIVNFRSRRKNVCGIYNEACSGPHLTSVPVIRGTLVVKLVYQAPILNQLLEKDGFHTLLPNIKRLTGVNDV